MTPLIGITAFPQHRESETYSALNENYTRSVRNAGGLPLLLPFDLTAAEAAQCIGQLDGLLLSGGADLAPQLFGEDPVRGVNNISQARDSGELALFAAAAKARLPVMGICRGCQVINVAMGGTLIQDIPSQVPGALGHSPQGLPMHEPYHRVDIVSGTSIMARAFGGDLAVTNSFHHQAIRDVAAGLAITARTRDDIIEAVEGTDPGWFVLAVQFHPEGQSQRQTEFLNLFRLFVDAARQYASRVSEIGEFQH
jgi:putative glutamine amidotransferase